MLGCVNRFELGTTASMSVSPDVLPANGNAYATVGITVSTEGQLLPASTQLVIFSSNPDTMITPLSAADANGWRWAQIRSLAPGTQTIYAQMVQGDLTVDVPASAVVTFNALDPYLGIPNAQTSWLMASPNTVADDGQTTTLLTLHVLDDSGVPVPGVGVTFTSSGTNNFFSADWGLTDVQGIFTTTLASTTPETKTVTARTDSIAVSTQTIFSPLASSALFSTLNASPTSLTADGVSTTLLTFTVLDAAGLPLPGAPVSWNVTGTNNTLVAASATTDGNGMVTATLDSTTAEIKTVTATSGATQLNQSVTFLPGPISSTTCTFVANPNLVTADNSSVAVLTFTARDDFGNPIPNINVALSSTGSNNTLSPLTGTTNAAGAFTATLASARAETKTVTATTGSINRTQTVSFLAGAPSVTDSVFTASPNVLRADGSTTTLTIVLEDAQGNPVPGHAVTFSTNGSNNIFGQTTGITDASGTLTTTLGSTTAQGELVTASFAGSNTSTDVTFNSGPPSSSATTLSAAPGTVVANGTTTSTLTAVVRDVYGNAVDAQLVTLSSTGSNNTFSAISGLTDTSGEFVATLASTMAEVKNITATAASATAVAAVTFTAGPANGNTTTFVANPPSVVADGSATSTLTVTVQDMDGNPIAGQSVSIASTGSNNTLSPLSGATNAAGVFTATLSSTKAETKTLTATIGTIVQTTTVTFAPGAPASGTTIFTANPTTVTADDTNNTVLTITVLDAFGNPIPNQTVSLSSSGSNNVFGSASGSTNSVGIYSTTLASSTAETKTLTAVAGASNKTAMVTFTGGAPNSSHCALSANPTALTADGVTTTQLTFTVKDAYGNAVVNQAVSLSSTGSNNTFTPTSGTTDSTGSFTATMASTMAEQKTITGTAGAATATTSVTFNAGAVSSLTTTLVANPNTLAADGSSQTALTTVALDSHGNPVPGQPVSLSGNGNSNVFSPNSGSTNASGVFTALLSSTFVQVETISAQVAGTVTANANVSFTAPLVNATSSTVVASPNSVTADGTSSSTITVTVLDDANSPVVGGTVNMTATGAGYTFTPVSGTTNGSGVFTTTLTSTQAGAKTVTAAVDGANLQTTVTFLAGAPVSTTTTFVASPNTVAADGVSHSVLTVVVEDSHGNPVGNQNVSLVASGGSNTLVPPVGTTDAAGTFTATLASTLEQTETLTATVNGFTKNANVTFIAGAVSGVTSTLVASPNTVTANGVAAATLTTTVKDAQGNPVANQSVVLSGTGSNNMFTPPSGSTNSAGVFTATMTSIQAALKVVTATIGTVNENANVLFVAGSVSSTMSTLVANPTSVTANGNTTTLTVTVEDANGNLIANQNVTFSGSGAANTFTPAFGPTNGNGVFTATLSSTVAQTEIITASVGNANLTASVTFTAGAPSSGTSSLVASPNVLVANGIATSTLTVTVKDAQGNPVPGQPVTLGSNGSSNTISPQSGNTTVAGVFTATFSSTKAEAKLVTATIGSVNKTATVTFTSGAPSNATTTVVASPTSVTADGASTTTLTVTVEDAYGNLVPNQTVTLSGTGSNNTFSPTTGTTNSVGVFTATLASITAETKMVTATVGSLTPAAVVTFTAGAPSNVTSQVTASPNMVTANGTSTTTVTVTVKDAHGNLVSNQPVSVSAGGLGNSWGALSGTTVAGVWSTTLASTVAQTESITATIGGFNETTSVTFIAGPPNGGTSSLVPSSSSVVDDGVATTSMQITVDDAQGNPVSNQAVTFSSTGTSYTFSATTCTTSAGSCSVTLKSTLEQTVTVTAAFAGQNTTATVTFVPGPPSSSKSTLTVSPTTVVANNVAAATFTLTVRDSTSNLVGTQAVTFTSTGSSYTFSSANGNTNASGVFTTTLKSTLAQVGNVTATFGGATESALVTFVAGPPVVAQSSFVASPTSGILANNSNTTLVTATLKDQYGNLVTSYPLSLRADNTQWPPFSQTGNTNGSGVFTFAVSSRYAGAKTVQDFFNGQSMSAAVTFSQPTAYCATTTSPIYTGALPLILGMNAPSGTLAVDMNGDSNNDAVFGCNGNAICVALGKGNGRFGTMVQYGGAPPGLDLIATCDLNADGHADIVSVNRGSGTVSAFLGSASGALGTPTNLTVTGSDLGRYNIACVDMNRDGKPDIVVAYANGNTASMFFGNGFGGFGTIDNQTLAWVPYNMAVGDVTGDGNQDLISPDGSGHVYILPGDGHGAWKPYTSYGVGAGDAWVSVADLNKDAKLDIVSVDNSNGSVSVLLNQGGGVYPAQGTGYPVTVPALAAIGDVNGDGNTDIVVQTSQDTAGVLLGKGPGTFGAASYFHVTGSLHAIALADFNRDGKLDLVASGQTSNTGHGVLYLGKGDGTFITPATYVAPSGPRGLAAGDITGDGYPDMVAVNYNSPSYATPYINAGNGTFSAGTALSVTGQPQSVSLVDINGDGHLDIVSQVLSGAGGLSVRLNLGAGTFGSEALYAAGGSNVGMAWGDFNADGVLDLATTNWTSNSGQTITVLLGQAAGGFAAGVEYAAGGSGSNTIDVAAADVNHDGAVDLVVAMNAGQFSVLLGVGNGTFGTETPYTPAGSTSGICAEGLGDFNLDGYTDVVTSADNAGCVAISNGTAGGTFNTGASYQVNGTPQSVAVTDINGDGLPDFIDTEYNETMVYVYMGAGNSTFTYVGYQAGNQPFQAAAADFNKDGHMDFAVTNLADSLVSVYLYSGCP